MFFYKLISFSEEGNDSRNIIVLRRFLWVRYIVVEDKVVWIIFYGVVCDYFVGNYLLVLFMYFGGVRF